MAILRTAHRWLGLLLALPMLMQGVTGFLMVMSAPLEALEARRPGWRPGGQEEATWQTGVVVLKVVALVPILSGRHWAHGRSSCDST